jgi:hypothetical protein
MKSHFKTMNQHTKLHKIAKPKQISNLALGRIIMSSIKKLRSGSKLILKKKKV